MPDAVGLFLAAIAGGVLGTFFFGGLWWTVTRGLSSAHPARLFIASVLLRVGGVLAGFYFLALSDWQRLVAALLGFTVARFLVQWRTGRTTSRATSPALEARHAPQP